MKTPCGTFRKLTDSANTGSIEVAPRDHRVSTLTRHATGSRKPLGGVARCGPRLLSKPKPGHCREPWDYARPIRPLDADGRGILMPLKSHSRSRGITRVESFMLGMGTSRASHVS